MYSYDKLIMSPRLKVAEHRGKNVLKTIFETLSGLGGHRLLPEDWGLLFTSIDDLDWQKRVICDFIAGMTDRYCVEFFERLTSAEPPSIHKPT